MRLFDINSGLRDVYAEYQPPTSSVHPWARSYPGLQEDMPRYDLLNMPPWSLAFCDDITLAHKVKGGRPRVLMAYDCVDHWRNPSEARAFQGGPRAGAA